MTFKDHFSTQSREYAAYRPTDPKELAEFLARIRWPIYLLAGRV